MTLEEFRNQEKYLLDWYDTAVSDKERKAAITTLTNLHSMMTAQNVSRNDFATLPPHGDAHVKPKRKKLTPREKFDKKNSRRAAIMAQRERRGQEE